MVPTGDVNAISAWPAKKIGEIISIVTPFPRTATVQ
jgi:hypothetical protein